MCAKHEPAMLWKFIDRPREDSLTAAIFSHLLHLPSEVFWQIMRAACPSAHFPTYPGEPRLIHAWPNWSAAGTRNSDRVIPDLAMEFDDFDLIIEAKRWDRPMQDREQWEAELQAYVNEYGSRKRPVIMVALGGIHSHEDETVKAVRHSMNANEEESQEVVCPVHMCQWSSILLACQRWRRKLGLAANRSSRDLADMRILNDLASLFIRHGIVPLRSFDDFAFSPNLLGGSAESERRYFRNISLQFQRS